MIINGSLYFDIQIGDDNSTTTYSKFLRVNDLIAFKMTEYTGASGIMVECIIRVYEDKIKSLFIQNNPVIIKFGVDENHAESIRIEITETNLDQDAQSKAHLVSFAGVLSVKYYREHLNSSLTGTSIDVIENINSLYFKKTPNLLSEIDVETHELKKDGKPMTWLRNYQTGMNYVTKAWLHMNLGENKCPLISLDRTGKFSILELNEQIIYSKPVCRFVSALSKSTNSGDILYLNNFTPRSYKFDSNLYCGYGNILNIKDVETGQEEIYSYSAKADIASTKEVESLDAGTKFWTNKYQNSNTYKGYKQCYYRNVFRLVQLSSIVGEVEVLGHFPNVNVMDIVELYSQDTANDGKYIINTKVTTFSSTVPIKTTFYLCRDNKNHIENHSVTKTNTFFKTINSELTKVLQLVRNLRRVTVMTRQVLDGTFIQRTVAYLNSFKYNLLTSFSLFGTTLNFNDSLSLLESLKASGNSLINQIIDSSIPYPFNYVLRNYALEQPSLKTLVSRLLYSFSPANEFRSLIVEIQGLFTDLTSSSSTIYESTYKQQSLTEYSQSGYSTGTLTYYNTNSSGEVMNLQENQKRVENITQEFNNNTSGVDIPIPQVSLTESESLLPDSELKDLLADKTIVWLEDQGYLNGVDNFKKILIGEESLDFNTITKINNNIGNMLYARYWGTFNSVEDFTDFYIKQSYKDIYVTAPTTKIINALRGAKIFIAFPNTESNLVFYINNKEVNMEVLSDVNIGLYTAGGAKLLYNVYMSSESFNSNSVVLEVRKNKTN